MLIVKSVEFESSGADGHPEFGRFHFEFRGPEMRMVQATFYTSQHTKGGGLGMAESGARSLVHGYLRELLSQLDAEAAAAKAET